MTESWIQIFTIVGSNLVIMLTIFKTSVSMHNSIRLEISELKNCVKDHHARLSVIEEGRK